MRAILAIALLAAGPVGAATWSGDIACRGSYCGTFGLAVGDEAHVSFDYDAAPEGTEITSLNSFSFSAGSFSLTKAESVAYRFSGLMGKDGLTFFDFTGSDTNIPDISDPRRGRFASLRFGLYDAGWILDAGLSNDGACMGAQCQGQAGAGEVVWFQNVAPVPLPAPILMLGAGIAILAHIGRKSRAPRQRFPNPPASASRC